MASPFLAFASGFSKKLSDINQENRDKQTKIEEKASANFERALELYHRNKTEASRMAKAAEDLARQLGNDPAAVEAAKFMVNNGFTIEQIELGKQYANSVRKKLSEGIVKPPAKQPTTEGSASEAMSAPQPAQPGMPQPGAQGMQPQVPQGSQAQQQAAQQAPTSMAANPAQPPQMPTNAAVPQLKPQDMGQQDKSLAQIMLGQKSPQQQQAGIEKRLQAESGMTPEQIRQVQAGQYEKPSLDMDTSVPAGEVDPGALAQQKAMLDWVIKNPDEIKDGMQDAAIEAVKSGQPITPYLLTRAEKEAQVLRVEQEKAKLRPERGATLTDLYQDAVRQEKERGNTDLIPEKMLPENRIIVERFKGGQNAPSLVGGLPPPSAATATETKPTTDAKGNAVISAPRPPPGKGPRISKEDEAKILEITPDPAKQQQIRDIYLNPEYSDQQKIDAIDKIINEESE